MSVIKMIITVLIVGRIKTFPIKKCVRLEVLSRFSVNLVLQVSTK